MAERWQRILETWQKAGLIDEATSERIHAFESARERPRGRPWPALVAVIFGALSLGAGVLLFVAAHWDGLSPLSRFMLVLLMVGTLHGTAAATHRLPLFASALHAAGTLSLGAGIYLSAQIFHLHERWPSGVGLWAFGAIVAWWLLRHTPQALLTALLVPAWLVSERVAALHRGGDTDLAVAQGVFLLAVVYLFARAPRSHDADGPDDGPGDHTQRGLSVLGAVALLPCALYLFAALDEHERWAAVAASAQSEPVEFAAHALAFTLPAGLGVVLRRKQASRFLGPIVWVAVLSLFDLGQSHQYLAALLWSFMGALGLGLWGIFDRYRYLAILGLLGAIIAQTAVLMWASDHEEIWVYGVCVLQAAVVVAGGMRFTNRDAINSGVVVFGLTVAFFYFSTVMDKLGRSLSLIGLGVLLLGGGFLLERTRRHLLAGLPQRRP
ncbi:MAG TPA: DUF2157 domain-containing protein [Polyangiaceae bacterium]|nr:DUF2157 domain-containing protein [Polyangiaceae bacterium]